MAIATVTSKGQITVPALIRAELNIQSGDRIEFVKVGEGRYEFVAASKEASQLKGMIKTKKRVSIDEMNRAIQVKAST